MPAVLKKKRTARASRNGKPKHSRTLADLVRDLGHVPLRRILLHPAPGRATEADLIRLMDGEPKRLCELVDGTLVEKSMGFQESRIAIKLIHFLFDFVEKHDLGIITGADGPYRMKSKNVRMPDATFISWSRFPRREDADTPNICPASPDLVVEILNESNTKKEIEKKRNEYLESGVQLVWIIDPSSRTVAVHRADGTSSIIDHKGKLSGEDVLPGFKLDVKKFL